MVGWHEQGTSFAAPSALKVVGGWGTGHVAVEWVDGSLAGAQQLWDVL